MERCIRYITKGEKQAARKQIYSITFTAQTSFFIAHLPVCLHSNEYENVER